METYVCLNCEKEFQAKKSAKRKFCCKQCSDLYHKGKENVKNQKKKTVICAFCGKQEEVPFSRAARYVCCSRECAAEYKKSQHSTQIKCICPVCNTEFWVKPCRIKRVKTQICCSRECSDKLKEITYLQEGNHQYGLIGHKNASFKGTEIISNLGYIFEYCPGHPRPCDSSILGTRVRQHRLVIERNHDKFDSKFFMTIDGWVILKEEYDVHHINGIKTDNRLENLQILTRSEHSLLHRQQEKDKINKFNAIIGVLKQGELLENPEVDNQQPSLDSNIFEGSTTNSRVLIKDSNADTSALLQQIKNIVGDDIV